MATVLWIAFLVAVLYGLAVSPAFRRLAGVLVVIAGAIIAMVVLRSNADEERRRTAIKPSEILFENLRLGGSGGFYRLTGTIRNGSQHTLDSLDLKIVVEDCNLTTCDTIGESRRYLLASVPPNQIRSIDESINFANMPAVRNRFAWRYEVEAIRAATP